MTDIVYKYFDEYLNELRQKGRFTFTSQEVIEKFDITSNAFKMSVQRLKEQNRVTRVRKGFYLILPPEYANRKTLPFGYYVDDLMQFLERDYYVALLTAAMYHGASHQQPQQNFVVTEQPYLRPIQNKNQSIIFCLKKNWNKKDINRQKTDAGYIKISNPSLTAVDLVFYVERIGGFSHATTVLSELTIKIDGERLYETSSRFDQTTTLQRLGYLLDYVISKKQLASEIYKALQERSFYPTLLKPSSNSDSQKAPNRWKVIPNIKVEPDI